MTTLNAATLLTPERVEEMAAQLAEVATRSLFLQRLAEVRGVPPADKTRAATEAIGEIKRDMPMPEGFRLTTRQFEMPQDKPYVDIGDGVATVVHGDTIITLVDKSLASEEDMARVQVPEHIRAVITDGIRQIGRFVSTPAFKKLLSDLYDREPDEQPAFVDDVVLNREERERRGIDDTAAGLIVQRSEFADGRPTLFCVTKILPLAYPWQKVTITFDSDREPVGAAADGSSGQAVTTTA